MNFFRYKKELTYFTTFWEGKYNYPPELEDINDTHISLQLEDFDGCLYR